MRLRKPMEIHLVMECFVQVQIVGVEFEKKKNRVSGIVDGPSLGDNGWSYVRVVGKFASFFMSILSSVNMEL